MASKLSRRTKVDNGTAGRWRRRWGTLLALIAAAGLSAVAVLAVHDTGRFELDGNAAATVSDDWDEVCHSVTGSALCGTSTDANGAVAVAWTGDCLAGSAGLGCN